jgi:hypothetical protein
MSFNIMITYSSYSTNSRSIHGTFLPLITDMLELNGKQVKDEHRPAYKESAEKLSMEEGKYSPIKLL